MQVKQRGTGIVFLDEKIVAKPTRLSYGLIVQPEKMVIYKACSTSDPFFIKWALELANQEYKGRLGLLIENLCCRARSPLFSAAEDLTISSAAEFSLRGAL